MQIKGFFQLNLSHIPFLFQEFYLSLKLIYYLHTTSTLDFAFKLYTHFLLIVQLIIALANDVKLTHPHRITSGREYLTYLSSFQISIPSVVQCLTTKLQFSSKTQPGRWLVWSLKLVNSVIVSGMISRHRQHVYLQGA